MRNIGASVMHQPRCIAASAEGGFKINGPSENGKGPMIIKEISDTSNEASLPQPTQAGRIKPCTELIKQAMRCLENNDKKCIMRKIEELVKNQCHNGYAVGKETADKARKLVHELWLASNHKERCKLLIVLRSLDVSRWWVMIALRIYTKNTNRWLTECGIDWENKITRNEVVKDIENLLRERFGWNEIRMCEEMWRFIGIDVDELRKYNIEPCVWLNGLELLSDLKRPYWLGLAKSDMTVKKANRGVRLELKTSNVIDAVFFAKILNMIKMPSIRIKQERRIPGMRYVHKPINLSYYIVVNPKAWPWPIELNADKLERILNRFNDEELAEYIAGEIDGDGAVLYSNYSDTDYRRNRYVAVLIIACSDCPKRMVLNVLKDIIAKRFNIIGNIYPRTTTDVLAFSGEDAVKLLRRIAKYIHHPLRRLRAELILALYDGRISPEVFEKLYEMTEYEYGGPDVKRNHALEVVIQAAPQTHTHGATWDKENPIR